MILTSLANVKVWLNINDTLSDAILTRLIQQASRMIFNYINRPDFNRQTFNEMQDGRGTTSITLRNYPVISVSSLTVWGTAIGQSNGQGTYGWALESIDSALSGSAQTLSIIGGYPAGASAGGLSWGCAGASPKGFAEGRDNVLISYQAGYCIQNEAQTVVEVSTNYQVTANQPDGTWSQDDGVTYATGVKMTPVASAPAAGQYTVAAGVYTFNVGDNAASVILNYSYIPFDVEQACIEIVAERFKYRNNIGVKSRSMGGVATDTFSMVDLQPYVEMMLNSYKRAWNP